MTSRFPKFNHFLTHTLLIAITLIICAALAPYQPASAAPEQPFPPFLKLAGPDTVPLGSTTYYRVYLGQSAPRNVTKLIFRVSSSNNTLLASPGYDPVLLDLLAPATWAYSNLGVGWEIKIAPINDLVVQSGYVAAVPFYANSIGCAEVYFSAAGITYGYPPLGETVSSQPRKICVQ
jgi:hypothetical protein